MKPRYVKKAIRDLQSKSQESAVLNSSYHKPQRLSRLASLTLVVTLLALLAPSPFASDVARASSGTPVFLGEFSSLDSQTGVTIGSSFYFTGQRAGGDLQIWKYDGTAISQVGPETGWSVSPENLRAVGTLLYFVGDASAGVELYRYDTVAGGTPTLIDINPGSGDSFPGGDSFSSGSFVAVGNALYFSADNGTNGFELWKSTAVTTTLVSDIRPGSSDSDPQSMVQVVDELYFAANDGVNGRELWKSNATTTTLVRDFRSGDSSSPRKIVFSPHFSALFFAANDGVNGEELWVYSEGGQGMLRDIRVGLSNGNIDAIQVIGDTVYFTADDRVGGLNEELWKYDGTTTSLVRDINVGGSSNPTRLVAAGDKNFFAAFTTPSNAIELWTTNSVGTTRVAEVDTSMPIFVSLDAPVAVGNYAYFIAETASDGFELWRSDGTNGSAQMFEVAVGAASSGSDILGVSGTDIFLRATSSSSVLGLYKLDTAAIGSSSSSGSQNNSSGGSSVTTTPVSVSTNTEFTVRFGAAKQKLTKGGRAAIRQKFSEFISVGTVVCTGFTKVGTPSSANRKLAYSRAERTCNLVKRVSGSTVPEVVVTVAKATATQKRKVRLQVFGELKINR